MKAPLIINMAPTGMLPTKKQTPYVPLSIAEIAHDVNIGMNLGVSMFHLHPREQDGLPTIDMGIWCELMSTVKTINSDIIICGTTSGRNITDPQLRANVLNLPEELRPDMASLTLGSMNFIKSASVNSPDTIRYLAKTMLENGIKAELEVFDLGMVNFAHVLIKEGLLHPPYYFNILLGNIATAQANIVHLSLIVNELPNDSIWSVTGLGQDQNRMTALGVVEADGVRIGLEDNIWYDSERTQLATNESLVKRVVNIANAYEREIAIPSDVRKLLNLK
jgi:3-keto-5-aminohexanoate cleavage enzyme